jgi:hypothetical protein
VVDLLRYEEELCYTELVKLVFLIGVLSDIIITGDRHHGSSQP